MKILVKSCIRKMDRIGAARPREGWRHADSKFRRTVSMKIGVEKR